jgi:hypothetical protein
LEYEDELFAALTAFLDYGSLSDGSSTFAESLYSLRCTPTRIISPMTTPLPRKHVGILIDAKPVDMIGMYPPKFKIIGSAVVNLCFSPSI